MTIETQNEIGSYMSWLRDYYRRYCAALGNMPQYIQNKITGTMPMSLVSSNETIGKDELAFILANLRWKDENYQENLSCPLFDNGGNVNICATILFSAEKIKLAIDAFSAKHTLSEPACISITTTSRNNQWLVLHGKRHNTNEEILAEITLRKKELESDLNWFIREREKVEKEILAQLKAKYEVPGNTNPVAPK